MGKDTSKSARKYRHLDLTEREEIAIGLEIGLKQIEIAIKLQRSPSTISREIKRNKSSIGAGKYRVSWAEFQAKERKRLSHKRKRIPQKS